MTFGSLFSGIGGFDLGFENAGMTCAWQVEREPFCQKVLRRRFDRPVFDDVTTVGAGTLAPVDVLVGGFPCQDLSVAGKREGLSGERSGLFYEFVRIAEEIKPTWVVIENVPGLLTSQRGRDFYALLTTLAECGFRRSYRILDSRYFGVAQRRRRVFLVLCSRASSHYPRTVLFEPEGGDWRPETGDEARARVAATLRGRSARRGVNPPERGGEDDANLVAFDNRLGATDSVAMTLRADCHQATPSGAFAITANYGDATARGDGSENLVANTILSGTGGQRTTDLNNTFIPVASCLDTKLGDKQWLESQSLHKWEEMRSAGAGVRRLTPLECERLQGFPDGWTCLCGEGHRGSIFCKCPDTPRYKALGNAVTVNVAEWIGRRLMAIA